MIECVDDVWDSVQTNKSDYLKHKVFTALQSYIEFYEQFSFSIFGFPSMGVHCMANIDSYLCSSAQGTLESISYVLKNGRICDAYALLRKYHESAIVSVYINLYLEDHKNPEDALNIQIKNWIDGKQKLPDYRVINKYVLDSEKLKPLTNILHIDERYKTIKNKCNDMMHYNSLDAVIVNDNEHFLNNRLEYLDDIFECLRDIVILNLSYLFFLKDHYMRSSDYMDAIEVGVNPEEGSQYWVCPYVQDMFNQVIQAQRPDIASLIIENTCMHLSTHDK